MPLGVRIPESSSYKCMLFVMHAFFLAKLNRFSRDPLWTFIAWFEDYSESLIDLDSELTDVPLYRWDYCLTSVEKHMVEASVFFIQEGPR